MEYVNLLGNSKDKLDLHQACAMKLVEKAIANKDKQRHHVDWDDVEERPSSKNRRVWSGRLRPKVGTTTGHVAARLSQRVFKHMSAMATSSTKPKLELTESSSRTSQA